MMFVKDWGDAFTQSLQDVWLNVAQVIPNIIIAVLIFVIGWVFASLVEKLVHALFKSIKVDNALRSAGVEDVVRHSGHNLNSGLFVGGLVKWFIIVVFLIASFDVLNLDQVNGFLERVVLYLPDVIIAVLILMVAAVVGEAMKKIVIASSRAANVSAANLLGGITKWAIWIFAVFAAVSQLGIAEGLILTLLQGIVLALAIAVGLAFGLGGKETASDVLAKVRKEIAEKN